MSKTTVASSGIDLSDSFAFTGTVTGAGRFNLLNTTTVSSDVASVQFNNSLITSTYSVYFCEFYGVQPATDQVQLFMGISTDNHASNTTSDMINRGFREMGDDSSSASAGFGDVYQTSAEEIRMAGKVFDAGGDTGRAGYGYAYLYNPTSSSRDTVWHWMLDFYANDGNAGFVMGAGSVESAAAHNSWRFKFSSGNIDNGTFKLYGVTT